MVDYKVELISRKTKDKLMFGLVENNLSELKANIHGTCVKFFTDDKEFKELWEENFKPMLEDIRPHCRIFSVKKGHAKNKVLYEPTSKTVLIFNCDYYGLVKSVALGLVADFFEDFTSEHKRYSIHGSFIDFEGRGIALIGPSGTGKTTLTYGLLLDKENNYLADDWFFVKMNKNEVVAYASEKNSYVRVDLAKNWKKFKKAVDGAIKDSKQRGVIDIKRVLGGERIKESSVLKAVVLLQRKKGEQVFQKLSQKQAIVFLEKNNFCNPHQLIKNKTKLKQRTSFFKQLFKDVPVFLLNTIETPQESLLKIKGLLQEF
ncbi:hypothetical protein HUU53_00890 [Candidatus Micrarchaeota archaeon]|nr:hypothetical protein [Candidatus Micrarchaeota archaeon]